MDEEGNVRCTVSARLHAKHCASIPKTFRRDTKDAVSSSRLGPKAKTLAGEDLTRARRLS